MKIFICEDNEDQRFSLEQVIVSVLEKEDIKET